MKKSFIHTSRLFSLSLAMALYGTLVLQAAGDAEKITASNPIVLINYDGMQGDELSNSGTLGGVIPFNRAFFIEEEGAPSGKEPTSLKVSGWTETTRSTFDVPALSAGSIYFWLKPGPPDEFYKNILDIGTGNLTIYALRDGILLRMGGKEYFVQNSLVEGEWVHFAFVFDQATDVGNVYINGEIVTPTVAPIDFKGLMAISATLDIAAAAYNGSLGSITILDRALSDEEVVSRAAKKLSK